MSKIVQATHSETVAYEVNGVIHDLRHRLVSTGKLPSSRVAKSCVLPSKFVELNSRLYLRGSSIVVGMLEIALWWLLTIDTGPLKQCSYISIWSKD